VDFQDGLRGMVVPWRENPAWKYAKVGKQIAAHDFCKWLSVYFALHPLRLRAFVVKGSFEWNRCKY
jgi:hypothetical protein